MHLIAYTHFTSVHTRIGGGKAGQVWSVALDLAMCNAATKRAASPFHTIYVTWNNITLQPAHSSLGKSIKMKPSVPHRCGSLNEIYGASRRVQAERRIDSQTYALTLPYNVAKRPLAS
jgi:hypothetical protein